MYVEKNFSLKSVIQFTGGHLIWITAWVSLVTFTYRLTGWEWMKVPWLPLSVIGTAVAFYIGFKNNQAYDRLWEARKIWGAIVNSSRAWGSVIKSYVTNQFTKAPVADNELFQIQRKTYLSPFGLAILSQKSITYSDILGTH